MLTMSAEHLDHDIIHSLTQVITVDGEPPKLRSVIRGSDLPELSLGTSSRAVACSDYGAPGTCRATLATCLGEAPHDAGGQHLACLDRSPYLRSKKVCSGKNVYLERYFPPSQHVKKLFVFGYQCLPSCF